jgi:phosphoglycerate kinase
MRTLGQAGNLAGKKVLVRNDFNITIGKDGKILDDYRIRASLPTIKYLLEQKAKIILSSHFARPEGKVVEEMRLVPVQKRLGEMLSMEIKLAPDCIGPEVENLASQLEEGEILLLENLRFHAEEETNDDEFARKLASLAEVYVNDAFGASHRVHASIVSITKYLPSFAGFLLQKEFEVLSRVLSNPERPLTVVIGGAKISTKMKLIEEYLERADHIILGGALANTVLHAQGIAVGKSLIEEDVIPELKKLKLTDVKLHIPVDVVTSTDKTGQAEIKINPVGRTEEGELILDIGPETEKVFNSVIRASKMVIWNGPMGLFEVAKFSHGTEAMSHSIADCPTCFSIIGGGETTCFVEKFGLIDKFSHVSTGGGAMLEFLAGDKLPGIEALK